MAFSKLHILIPVSNIALPNPSKSKVHIEAIIY
jgi:hypothetical protein